MSPAAPRPAPPPTCFQRVLHSGLRRFDKAVHYLRRGPHSVLASTETSLKAESPFLELLSLGGWAVRGRAARRDPRTEGWLQTQATCRDKRLSVRGRNAPRVALAPCERSPAKEALTLPTRRHQLCCDSVRGGSSPLVPSPLSRPDTQQLSTSSWNFKRWTHCGERCAVPHGHAPKSQPPQSHSDVLLYFASAKWDCLFFSTIITFVRLVSSLALSSLRVSFMLPGTK